MPLSAYDTIFDRFPAATAEQWKAKIIAELKGGDFEGLISTNADGIPVLPFYPADDAGRYRLDIPVKTPRGWLTAERIRVQDLKQANAAALDALQQGAMCIFFDLQRQELDAAEIRQLTEGILLDIAPVYFENHSGTGQAVLQDNVPGSCPPTVIVPQLESKSDELVFAVAKGMQLPGDQISIHFFTGGNYFMEIAKLRAFRWLWKQVNTILQSDKKVFIVSETGMQQRSETDENQHILRNTTEAMSAILGGCDALLVNPHNHREDSVFGKRIARNVQHILRHESGLGEPGDIGRGAYFIEYLTYVLSNKVWEKLAAS